MQRWLPYAISLVLHLALALLTYQAQGTVVSFASKPLAHQLVMPKLGIAYDEAQANHGNDAAIAEASDNPFEMPELDEAQGIQAMQVAQAIAQETDISTPKDNDDSLEAEHTEYLLDSPIPNTKTTDAEDLEPPSVLDSETNKLSQPSLNDSSTSDDAKTAQPFLSQNQALLAPTEGSSNVKPQGKTANTNAQNTNAQNTNSNIDDARLWEAYVKVLNQHFSAKKFYPDMARKLGHRGTVWVSLKLSRSGSLLNAQIETSSGSALLDRAALEAAQMAIPAPPFPAKTQENDRIVRIPYRYL